MWRRVKRNNAEGKKPSVFIGKVGGPYPAPPPARGNITLPSVNMNMDMGMGGFPYAGGPVYGDMGLDDYNALHYYGLDGLDNIDF